MDKVKILREVIQKKRYTDICLGAKWVNFGISIFFDVVSLYLYLFDFCK